MSKIILCACLILCGCQNDDGHGHPDSSWQDQTTELLCMDSDGDSFKVGPDCDKNEPLDCNDSEKTIFPGQTELCDSIDNDCDGVVDEDILPLPCPLNNVIGSVCEANNAHYACIDGQQNSKQCSKGCFVDGFSPQCIYGADFVLHEVCDFDMKLSDQKDNDCDGEIDEGRCFEHMPGDHCGGASCNNCPCSVEGTLQYSPSGGLICADSEGTRIPDPFDFDEIPGNGIDEDCSGTID